MGKKKKKKQATFKYRYKRKPYRHQVAALKDLLSRDFGGALLMSPRTGKTQPCIDYASIRHLQGKVNRVLVTCPVSVIGVWEDEIAAVCPVPYRIVVWDRDGRKEQELPRYGRDILDFVIMNHEALSTPGEIIDREEDYVDEETGKVIKGAAIRSTRKGGRYDVIKKLKRWQPQLIVCDESHRIKSPSAKKSSAHHTLAKVAEYRIVATGTSITKRKRIWDIYSQWKFLNPSGWVEGWTLGTFKAYFSVTKQVETRAGGKYEKWIRNNNEQELYGLIHQDAFAVTREECYDLDIPREQIIPVYLSERTAKAYDEMAENMITELKEGAIATASIPLVVNLRLATITGGVVRIDPRPGETKGKLVRIGREKLQVLEERCFDLFEADEHVVICARFTHDIQSILKALRPKRRVAVYELSGRVPRAERTRNIREFNLCEGPAAFVMQPAAGSLGIDLRSAGTMIWYSLTESMVDWSQCKDRIALNPNGTMYEYLLARGTVDYEMFENLHEDESFGKRIQRSPEALRRNFKPSRTS